MRPTVEPEGPRHLLPLTLCFVDRSARFLQAVEPLCAALKSAGVGVTTRQEVRSVPVEGAAFVSPSNSLLWMDGGIDAVYSDMFPGVQRALQSRVQEHAPRTAGGRWYLPVGCALLLPLPQGRVPRASRAFRAFRASRGSRRVGREMQEMQQAQQTADSALIAAPTMFQPTSVAGTRHAYHACAAAVALFLKARASRVIDCGTLVLPALCCGYGEMSAEVAAGQMADALQDVLLEGRLPEQVGGEGGDPCWWLGPDRDEINPP